MKPFLVLSTPIGSVMLLLFGLVVVVAPGNPPASASPSRCTPQHSHVSPAAGPGSVALVARRPGADPGACAGRWVLPVRDAHSVLTAGFGECGARWAHCHTGQDFAIPTGTRIVAAGAGVVTFAGWAGSYGNCVHVLHAGGIATWYAHLSRIRIRDGARVDPGTRLGRSGATGNTTGPHLHFEVRLGASRTEPGTPIDPLPWLRRHHLL